MHLLTLVSGNEQNVGIDTFRRRGNLCYVLARSNMFSIT